MQPVLLDYSANRHFNPGWGLDESTPWHFWRLLTQLRTHIRLKILPVRHLLLHFVLHHCEADQAAAPVSSDTAPEPSRALKSVSKLVCWATNSAVHACQVYHPSAEEKADARLYAENVRLLMSRHLSCPCVDYGTSDEFLLKTGGVYVDKGGRRLCLWKKGMAKPVLLARIDKLPALQA